MASEVRLTLSTPILTDTRTGQPLTKNPTQSGLVQKESLRIFNKLTIVRQGYLSKKSAILKVFRKRWMVVFAPNVLVSYKTKSKKAHKITEIFDLSAVDNIEISKTKKNEFKLSFRQNRIHVMKWNTGEPPRIFKAGTNEEMLDWIKCLESVIYQNSTNFICRYSTIQPASPWYTVEVIDNDNAMDETTMSYISIPIVIVCKENVTYGCKFRVNILYNRVQLTTIQQLLEDCRIHLTTLYPSIICASYAVYSRQKSQNKAQLAHPLSVDQYLDHYTIKHLREGFTIQVTIPTTSVTGPDKICNHLKKTITNPKQCPIYKKMMHEYCFNDNYLTHLNQFNHFKDEYMEKPECKYNDKCFAYVRLEKGGNKLDDRCHVKLFRHPPRRRRIKLDNTNSFKMHTSFVDNHEIYNPINDDEKDDEKDELQQLISEVIKNGYKEELCMKNEDDIKNNNYSLLYVVDEKLKSPRHKSMGFPLNRAEMLSLILYTGCDCNYDLCKTQRNGNYLKWKWFDKILYNAISKLSERENGFYNVYSGLNKVKLEKKFIECGYFTTYVSTSWIKDVAVSFMEGDGMIIEVNRAFTYHNKCCNVSWISKFPDECEILIARSVDLSDNNFECKILDDHDGVQTVALSNRNNIENNFTVISSVQTGN